MTTKTKVQKAAKKRKLSKKLARKRNILRTEVKKMINGSKVNGHGVTMGKKNKFKKVVIKKAVNKKNENRDTSKVYKRPRKNAQRG